MGKAEATGADITTKLQAVDDAITALPRYPGKGTAPDLCRMGPSGNLELYDPTGASVLVTIPAAQVRGLMVFLAAQYGDEPPPVEEIVLKP